MVHPLGQGLSSAAVGFFGVGTKYAKSLCPAAPMCHHVDIMDAMESLLAGCGHSATCCDPPCGHVLFLAQSCF